MATNTRAIVMAARTTATGATRAMATAAMVALTVATMAPNGDKDNEEKAMRTRTTTMEGGGIIDPAEKIMEGDIVNPRMPPLCQQTCCNDAFVGSSSRFPDD